MKIYDSFGPNPRALRMFLAEKNVDFPKVTVDLMGAENRRAPYTEKNPGGQLPALEPDAHRPHAGGARRGAHVATPDRAQDHRAPLQWLSFRRGRRSLSVAHARP